MSFIRAKLQPQKRRVPGQRAGCEGIPTIVKDASRKSFRDVEERAQPFSPASSNPLHMAFLLPKSKRIHLARDSDHWSLTFRPQQGKDWERDVG